MTARWLRLTLISVFSGIAFSCAAKMPQTESNLLQEVEIQDIRVAEGSEKTVIEIEGEEPIIYTTFHLTEPDRLVVDMAGVSLGRFRDEMTMSQGPIRALRPVSGGGSNVSRLEFVLDGSVETEVRTDGLNLIVEATQLQKGASGFVFFEEAPAETPPSEELPPEEAILEESSSPETALSEDEEVPTEPEGDGVSSLAVLPAISPLPLSGAVGSAEGLPFSLDGPVSEKAAGPVSEVEKAPTQKPSEPTLEVEEKEAALKLADAPDEALAPAKEVRLVRFDRDEHLKLIIVADGKLSPRIFYVDDKRLVIDLPGVKKMMGGRSLPADDPLVKQVRMWQHPKKLRLVLDLLSPLPYSWSQDQGTMEVALIGTSSGTSSEKPGSEASPPEEAALEAIPVPLVVPEKASSDELITDSESASPETALVPKAEKTIEKLELDEESASEDADSEHNGAASLSPVLGVALLATALPPVAAPPPLPLEEKEPLVSEKDLENKVEADEPIPLQASEASAQKAKVVESDAEAGAPAFPPEGLVKPLPAALKKTSLTAAPLAVLAKKVDDDENAALKRKRRDKIRLKRASLLRAKNRSSSRSKSKDRGARSALLSPLQKPKYTGRKISLDFQDADISNVIRLIADVSKLNFVMGDDVEGKVTLKVNNVPWDQALDIILKVHNLGQVREGSIIRIATLASLSKQRDEEAHAKETKIKAEDLLNRVVYINYGKAKKLSTLLKKLLSPRGEIMVSERVNALIVKDIAQNLAEIEKMAKRLDTKTPQVLIEARIVEIKPTFKQSLGVQWGANLKTTQGGNVIGLGNPIGSPFTSSPPFSVNLPASDNFGGLGFTFGRLTQSPFTLDLRLSAGETQGMTRIVSTPKIMVLDNHEALIEQGESIPFQTDSGNNGKKIEFIDANLKLQVTPHISPDGGVMLDVHLTKNERGDQFPVGVAILKKEITTRILLMNTETMVIGGIYETKKFRTESGIPWLKDLPFVGWLFRKKERDDSVSELLVFLTPTVMD